MTAEEIFNAIKKYFELKLEEKLIRYQKALLDEEEAYFSSQNFQEKLKDELKYEKEFEQDAFHFSEAQREQVKQEILMRAIEAGTLPPMDKEFIKGYFKDFLAERVPDKKENKKLFNKASKDQKKLNKQRKKKNEETDNFENEVINTENDLEDWLNKQVDIEESNTRSSLRLSDERKKQIEREFTHKIRKKRNQELNKKLNDQRLNTPLPTFPKGIEHRIKLALGRQDQEKMGIQILDDYNIPEQSGFYVVYDVSTPSNEPNADYFNDCYDILKDISNGEEKWTFIAPQSEEEVISLLKQYETQPQSETEKSIEIKKEHLNKEKGQEIQEWLTEQFETQYSDEEKAALVIYKTRMFNLIGRLWQMSPKVEDINMDDLKQQLSSSESEISKISKSLISFFNKAKENPENQEFFEKYMSDLDFSSPEKLVETTLQQMAILENVGKKIKAPENITLFRGVNRPIEWKDKTLDKLSQSRFVSTSPDYKVAQDFIKASSNTLFRLRIQKGTPIIPMFFSVKKNFNCSCNDSQYADYSDLPSDAITISVSHENIQSEIILDSELISYDLANEESASLTKQIFKYSNPHPDSPLVEKVRGLPVSTGKQPNGFTNTFYPQVEVFAKELTQQKEDENFEEEESTQESNDEDTFDTTSTPLDNIDTNKKDNDKNDEDDNDDEDEPGNDC